MMNAEAKYYSSSSVNYNEESGGGNETTSSIKQTYGKVILFQYYVQLRDETLEV